MHKVTEVLRLRLQAGLRDRAIARCLKLSPTTVGDYLRRAADADLGWPLPDELDDDELERRLFPPPATPAPREPTRPLPDGPYIAAELRREHVTLTLLWQEYKDEYPDGYEYTQFCEHYRRFAQTIDVSMRQTHLGGEKLFVDYSGDGITYVDRDWDPDINTTYADMARHYGTTIVPARPRRPNDKAKAENGVLLAQRWINAALRNHTFYSVTEINKAIRELLAKVDQRKLRKLQLSRLELFDKLDRPELSPLPTERYEFREWMNGVRVGPRLPRHRRLPRLQRAVSVRPQAHRHRGEPKRRGVLSQAQSCREPRSQLRARRRHDRSLAHASVTSQASRVLAVDSQRARTTHRYFDSRARRDHSRRASSSRAGIPRLPGNSEPHQALRRGASGERLLPCACLWVPLLRLPGSAEALDPEELVGLLVDAEWTGRENRKLTARLRRARFPLRAHVEEINYRHPRGLRKQVMLDLISCRWIAARQNLSSSGPTGLGKSWLPCALGEKACRDGYSVLYTRCPTIFEELRLAHADGTYPNLLRKIAKTQLLIVDDFGSAALDARERRDLREIFEGRYSVSSTIVTSQLAPQHWHSFIGDDTVADAICDRLIHNAHRLELDGESMRKIRGLGGDSVDT